MEPTEEQKSQIDFLLATDEKIEAIRYAQKEFNLDAEQAISFIERWEKEVEAEDEAAFEQATKEVKVQSTKVTGLIGNIFGGIGVLLLVLGVYFGYRSYSFIQRAVKAEGRVVELVRSMSHNSEDNTDYEVWSPVVEYQYQGKTHRFKSPIASSQPDYEVGDPMPLLVDPDRPGTAEEDSFFGHWFVAVLLSGMGIIFTGVGFAVSRIFAR